MAPKPWKKIEFFLYLQQEMAAADPPIQHVGELAELAGFHPSTISGWKNNRSRPNVSTLTAIAHVLGKEPSEVIAKSGILAGNPAFQDDAGERPDSNVEMIRASKLPPEAQEKLIRVYQANKAMREQRRREEADEERRRLREQIELLESMAPETATL